MRVMAGLQALAAGEMTLKDFIGTFAGKRIPCLRESAREAGDRRAYELLPAVGATIAAERLGISRAGVYRAAFRHAERLKNSLTFRPKSETHATAS